MKCDKIYSVKECDAVAGFLNKAIHLRVI